MDWNLPRCAVCGDCLAPIKHCLDCGIPVHAKCYPPAAKKAKFKCDPCVEGLDAYICELCNKVWSRAASSLQPAMLVKEGSCFHAVCLMVNERKNASAKCCSCSQVGGRMMTCAESRCSRKSHPSCALLDRSLRAQDFSLKYFCPEHDRASDTKPPQVADEEDVQRNSNGRRRGPARSAKTQARQSIVMDSVLASLENCMSERVSSSSSSSESDIAASDTAENYSSSSPDSVSSSESEIGTDEDYESDEAHGRGISLYDSVHFRPPQKSHHTSVFAPDSFAILNNVSETIEKFIADRIAKMNHELFMSMLAYFETPLPAMPTTVFVTGVDRSDNHLRYQRLREFFQARDFRVAFLQKETSVVDCLWNIVTSLNERKTSFRPESVLEKLLLHNPLLVVIDSLESLNQTVVNCVIQRLTTLKNVFLIVGVSSHVEMLHELLSLRTFAFLTIREFRVQTEPVDDVLPELLFSSRLPIQLGPTVIEHLQRVYEASNRSMRVLGSRIKTAVMLRLDAKSKICPSPSADAARDEYWRAFAAFCELLNNVWVDNDNRFVIAGITTSVEKFIALQSYNDSANARHPLVKVIQCLRACRNRSVLSKMLSLWHDLFARMEMADEQEKMQYLLVNFDNLESLDQPATVSTKTSKRNRKLLTAASDSTSVPAINIVSSRMSAFFLDLIKRKLPPLRQLQPIKDILFDNADALKEISIESIESFVMQSLSQHPESDTAQIFRYIGEATSISVDFGSIFMKFSCMNPKVDETKLQVRFLQAIEDLCVLGVISHSTRAGYMDRVISLRSR